MDNLLTTTEAAERMGVTAGRIKQLVAEGRLPVAFSSAGRNYVRPADVDRVARELAKDPRSPNFAE